MTLLLIIPGAVALAIMAVIPPPTPVISIPPAPPNVRPARLIVLTLTIIVIPASAVLPLVVLQLTRAQLPVITTLQAAPVLTIALSPAARAAGQEAAVLRARLMMVSPALPMPAPLPALLIPLTPVIV